MCIIISKPQGVYLPKKDALKRCFENNPDGAGIMLTHKRTVYGFKGLMSYTALEKKLRELKGRFGPLDKLPMVLHFRIGTSGDNVPGNTHPFPLSNDYERMRKLEWKADLGIAHNGVIPALSCNEDVFDYNVSDTMIFIKRCVYPLSKLAQLSKDEQLLDILEIAADSKLAFLDRDGKISLRGRFYPWEGCLFSNNSYKEDRQKSAWSARLYGGWSEKWGYPQISIREESVLKQDAAKLDGVTPITQRTLVLMEGGVCISLDAENAIDKATGEIYKWDEYDCVWYATGETCVSVISDKEESSI